MRTDFLENSPDDGYAYRYSLPSKTTKNVPGAPANFTLLVMSRT